MLGFAICAEDGVASGESSASGVIGAAAVNVGSVSGAGSRSFAGSGAGFALGSIVAAEVATRPHCGQRTGDGSPSGI